MSRPTIGSQAQASLLQVTAERLQSCLRPQDTVARFGGDEFAVLLENTDLKAALPVAHRMLDSLSAPIPYRQQEVRVGTSIGLASARPRVVPPEQILADADTALYVAKSRGRNRLEVFAPAMRQVAEKRSRTLHELDDGVAGGQLRLHYQPIVDLATGQHSGAEALVRWQHPRRGLLLPGEFIPLAEQGGQISALGEWVLHTACRDAMRLPPGQLMSVNISARQLPDQRLTAAVTAALQASGLDAGRLILEITETSEIDDAQAAITQFAALKSRGVQLALDDFGTGYSTLSHLRTFPVDFVKIDRSFVAGITSDEEDRALVRSVVEMAHAFGLRTIAEGIELEAQRVVLAEHGCDYGQGFLWTRARPLPGAVATLPRQRSPEPVLPASGLASTPRVGLGRGGSIGR